MTNNVSSLYVRVFVGSSESQAFDCRKEMTRKNKIYSVVGFQKTFNNSRDFKFFKLGPPCRSYLFLMHEDRIT